MTLRNDTHVIIANDGFVSGPMSGYRAIMYAVELRRLGNYKVWITEVENAPNIPG